MEFDFSTNGTVDKIDLVPEQFRPVYVESDGKFTIDPRMKGVADAISGLNSALRNERKTTTTLKGQKDVSAAIKEALGLESLDEAKARMDELTQQVAEKSKVDPAKIKADIEKAFNTERETLKGENAKMKGSLERYLVDAAAATALNDNKGNAKLLLPIIKQAVAVVQDGDEFVVRVKDAAGDYRGNGQGGFMTVADYVKELKASPDYGVAFQSDAPAGGGRRPEGGQQTSRTTADRAARTGSEERTPAQKISDGLRKRGARN
jgi:polyhydroxyalkanoate synthesis regulator phasin